LSSFVICESERIKSPVIITNLNLYFLNPFLNLLLKSEPIDVL
jgi:hypothetical protein